MDFSQKAIVVIEYLARFIDLGDDDAVGGGLALIYKAAHCVNAECGKAHSDWRDEVLTLFDSLVRDGKYNPNGRKANLN